MTSMTRYTLTGSSSIPQRGSDLLLVVASFPQVPAGMLAAARNSPLGLRKACRR
jgi:hypothetical protein